MLKSNTSTKQSDKGASRTVMCRYCLHSDLIQYDHNPILAACHKQPQPYNARFPYKIEVACVERCCSMYALCTKEKEIERRTRHAKKEAVA